MTHPSVSVATAPIATTSRRVLATVAARWLAAGLVTGAVIVGLLLAVQEEDHDDPARNLTSDGATAMHGGSR